MSDQILIRDVPQEVQDWIEQERHKRMMTKKEFLLSILIDASESKNISYAQNELFSERKEIESKSRFIFSDFFSGIGGFRLGLEKIGGGCVFSCEWDKFAQKTYFKWFNDKPVGDIKEVNPEDIPDHDILTAGFPCQPFSIAGVSKKQSLGREHGFKDKTQGTLFFYLANIIEKKRPPVLILENVKNLISHDKGKTWKIIKGTLESMEYIIFWDVIDAKYYVPQHRERVFIVCFDRRIFGEKPDFKFPDYKEYKIKEFGEILENKPDSKYTLSDHLWKYLQEYAKKHKEKGNGFGYSIADEKGVSRTLSARYHKDGSEILVSQGSKRNPRRLTPKECARLMGFVDYLPIIVSDTQAYRQFGNAVVPLIVQDIGKNVLDVMRSI